MYDTSWTSSVWYSDYQNLSYCYYNIIFTQKQANILSNVEWSKNSNAHNQNFTEKKCKSTGVKFQEFLATRTELMADSSGSKMNFMGYGSRDRMDSLLTAATACVRWRVVHDGDGVSRRGRACNLARQFCFPFFYHGWDRKSFSTIIYDIKDVTDYVVYQQCNNLDYNPVFSEEQSSPIQVMLCEAKTKLMISSPSKLNFKVLTI